ncbi:MAG: ferrous iron transport protein B [Candidatus Burarchaeum sp.]|nr:ferrous iron transport protein B [Candidatus Burarchaeum sp.]MDO8339860.1 ferrous iron transport protein B [Candidatus Burarchaeum sp.]
MSAIDRLLDCHSTGTRGRAARKGDCIRVALAGNANVGKSSVFNRLTGTHQIIGNWPGKTVEVACGFAEFRGQKLEIVDLPGIYSLSAFSPDETVSRDYIADEGPDAVINVIDASVLERNLYFTLQLLEMGAPLVVCLNQVDFAAGRGIRIDDRKLEALLGVPVVPTVAIAGRGMDELVERTLKVAKEGKRAEAALWVARKGKRARAEAVRFAYSKEVESKIGELAGLIEASGVMPTHPSRWIAIRLLESDSRMKRTVGSASRAIVERAEKLAEEIARLRKIPCYEVIALERYAMAAGIAKKVRTSAQHARMASERLDEITTHREWGYAIAACVMLGLLLWTFVIGNFLSLQLSNVFALLSPLEPKVAGNVLEILWNGAFGGLVAGVTLVIPFVIPFYFLIAFLEDSGYLTRLAFVFDSALSSIGLHGKAIIPLLLGYGCSVPAILSCRIMETRRERLLAAFAITLIPCSARTIVILGLVAAFVGIEWALALYIIDLVIVLLLGRLALRALPGKGAGLMMEMHAYRMPSPGIVAKQTWARTKSLIYIVFPIYIVGSALMQLAYAAGLLAPVNSLLAPITVGWLGLPEITGIMLVFGVVRKELTILMLAALVGTTQFALVLSPVQMMVLALVTMLYIPCLATISALAREFDMRTALAISAAEVVFALIVGGVAARLLPLVL